jgi:hypothetical protein
MAQYQHLPIYKVTYELLQQITRVTKEFPRDYRHSLAAKLREESVDLVVFIYKANSIRSERARHVAAILERMQVIELLVRLCKDLRLMSIKQFSETVALTDSVGRQAQGWLKAANSALSAG